MPDSKVNCTLLGVSKIPSRLLSLHTEKTMKNNANKGIGQFLPKIIAYDYTLT